MSDLLIKGMEMPKDGDKLYMIAFSDGKACASYKPFEWHEVVPVPEPYGRLIDADEFLKRAIGTKCFRGDFALMLEELVGESTTVIPATEEAE